MKDLKPYLLKEFPDEDGNYVYLLLCENNSLYCGWTTNLKKRYEKHANGTGAKYTRMHRPIGIFYYESFENAIYAQKREYAIKRMTHKEKCALRMIY